jgi:hypothetical protein
MSVAADFKFRLGECVRDKVTGFKGAIVSRADHISGCATYGVQPTQLKDGADLQDAKWFDEPRLASTGELLPEIDDREAKTGADSVPQRTRL